MVALTKCSSFTTRSTVYEYNRDNGSFIGSFALAGGNGDPQGIADPLPWSRNEDPSHSMDPVNASSVVPYAADEYRPPQQIDALNSSAKTIPETAFVSWNISQELGWLEQVRIQRSHRALRLVDEAVEDLDLTEELLTALTLE